MAEVVAAHLDLGAAPWLSRPETQAVLGMLTAGGFAARVVGGAVRNGLMGRPVTDVDIATTALPDATLRLANAAGFHAVPTGLAHGTITVVVDRVPFEVTTLRRDVETFGRHATVAFTDDWADDARRRDFTINALYCDGGGRVFDPLGGLPDLAARRVRFVGDPDQRIQEDYLRSLRFFRFHATYAEGQPDRPALDAVVRGRAGLAGLSGERIRQELLKLLAAPGAVSAVEAMAHFGVLAHLLPIAPRPGVLRRLAEAEAVAGVTPDAVLRLGALTVAVTDDADRLASRLKLASVERDLLGAIPLFPSLDPALGEASARVVLYRLGAARYRQAVLWALAISTSAQDAPDAWRQLFALPERWTRPSLPVGGEDVLALGVAPGPAIGRILADVEAWWVAAGFPDDRGVVLARLSDIAARKP